MRFATSLPFAAVFCVVTTAHAAATVTPGAATPPLPASIAANTSWTDAAASTPAGYSASAAAATEATGAEALPDSPVASDGMTGFMGQSGNGGAPSNQPIAPKYSTTILPGQTALPLHSGDKVGFAFRDAVSPFSFLSMVISATYSQGVDSQPHYGQGWAPYGQRIGAAAARSTVQTLATEAVFAPIFRDDPRYYVLGRGHKFLGRVVYAATRVVVTRTDSGHNTVNAPLLLGYAAAAGANMAYYPQRDRNFHDAATGYLGSLGGGVLGMEVNEFIDDALRIVHLRK